MYSGPSSVYDVVANRLVFAFDRSLIEGISNSGKSLLPSLFTRVVKERGVVHISNLLGNVVDFIESQQENTVVIRSGVSEALDAARERYEDLDNVRCWKLTKINATLTDSHICA